MAFVELSGISKSFGAVSVLHNVSLEIQSGQFVTLVGPSGCGKSTLLRLIAGLEDISEGMIRIADRVVNNVPSKDRDISMVFQNYALYPHMTVAENMAFSLRIRSVAKDKIEDRVAKAARMLELSDLLQRYPKQLSGGQRQRVAMGRAVVRDPAVFLFDEPLSNLDASLRVQMRAEIKEMHHRLGSTMIYVTHDQVEALSMADVVVVMRQGRIEQAGPPLELYDRPANIFVAQFIGSPSMNLLYGHIVRRGETTAVAIEGGHELPLSGCPDVPAGHKVVLGVRPNRLGFGDQGIPARVIITELLGAETQLLVKIEGSTRGPVTILLNERVNFKPGQEIRLNADVEQLHLFDADTGLRLNY
jgi:multiple sugar transport system ATP-binding protein